jgi:predicted DNA-binding protein (MmcQ/YjbR family)
MPKPDVVLAKMKEICLALPDTKLTMTWGTPHFRVGEKIFAGCGEEGGKASIGFKLEMEHARQRLADPRFSRAAYVGRYGWVSMDATRVKDWEEVRALIHESYRLIAPKRLVAKMSAAPAPGTKTRKAGVRPKRESRPDAVSAQSRRFRR